MTINKSIYMALIIILGIVNLILSYSDKRYMMLLTITCYTVGLWVLGGILLYSPNFKDGEKEK